MVGLYAATSGGRVFAWTAAVGLPVWLFMLGFRPRLPGEELEQRG